LNMGYVCSSETVLNACKTLWCHNQEDYSMELQYLHLLVAMHIMPFQHCPENLNGTYLLATTANSIAMKNFKVTLQFVGSVLEICSSDFHKVC